MQDPKFNKAMGAVIRRHRLLAGMTQESLGTALGVTFQQIQKYERGVNGLAAHYLAKVAAVFGVAISDLYQEAGVATVESVRSPAQNDAFLAARYVQQIENPTVRSIIIDIAKKYRYEGAAA